MADWQSLGLVNPSLNEWTFLPIPTVGGETFRASFVGLGTISDRRWRSYALIDGVYYNGDSGTSFRVWPNQQNEIFSLPIPAELKQSGIIVRYLRVRKVFRGRVGRASEPNWSIQIEELLPDTPPLLIEVV